MITRKPITIKILATSDTSPSTLFGLYDVLASAGVAWEHFVHGEPGEGIFDVRIVAATAEPFICGHEVLVSPYQAIDKDCDADITIVASFVVPSMALLEDDNDRELEWLERQRERGSIIVSACTGALMLAESGMLDGLEATTHWAFGDLFRTYYPEVKLRLESELCVSGVDDQIVTCGGATSWQRMALYLIARFSSAEDASNTAKFWRIPILVEGHAAFSGLSQSVPHDDGIVSDCLRWIADNYSNPHPVNHLISESGLAPTTFSRRFKRATGFRPMDYIHMVRIEEAKSKLESSDDAVENIGLGVGYEDPASFRRIFKRKVGLTPSVYRRKFSHSLLVPPTLLQ